MLRNNCDLWECLVYEIRYPRERARMTVCDDGVTDWPVHDLHFVGPRGIYDSDLAVKKKLLTFITRKDVGFSLVLIA